MKGFRYSAILLNLSLVLMACHLIQPAGKQPGEPVSAATSSLNNDNHTDKASQIEQANPVETKSSGINPPDPTQREKPPQSQAAEIRLKDMRTPLTYLSNLIGYQVLDENGEKALGVGFLY